MFYVAKDKRNKTKVFSAFMEFIVYHILSDKRGIKQVVTYVRAAKKTREKKCSGIP